MFIGCGSCAGKTVWGSCPENGKAVQGGSGEAVRVGRFGVIEIASGLGINERELNFSCDRSPGPGGQNVNKAHTRVTLIFDVGGSLSLSSQQKKRVCEALGSRVSRDGVLRVVSCKERTQLANRRAAVNRFIELIGQALQTQKPRKETVVPASADRRRLVAKAQKSQIKELRRTKVAAEQ